MKKISGILSLLTGLAGTVLAILLFTYQAQSDTDRLLCFGFGTVALVLSLGQAARGLGRLAKPDPVPTNLEGVQAVLASFLPEEDSDRPVKYVRKHSRHADEASE